MRVGKGLSVVCKYCGLELAAGVRVVSHNGGGRYGRSRIYHEKCYEATFVDAP